MIEGWNESVAKAVEQLYCEMEFNAGCPVILREAAVAAGGLPVYCDMGGCLIITPAGNAVRFDADSRTVVEEIRAGWQTLALIAASERHVELRGLRPKRRIDATVCGVCDGRGKCSISTIESWCGSCYGTGWV